MLKLVVQNRNSGTQNTMETTKEKTVSPRTGKYNVNSHFFVLVKLNKSTEEKDDILLLFMSRKLYRSNVRFTECTG